MLLERLKRRIAEEKFYAVEKVILTVRGKRLGGFDISFFMPYKAWRTDRGARRCECFSPTPCSSRPKCDGIDYRGRRLRFGNVNWLNLICKSRWAGCRTFVNRYSDKPRTTYIIYSSPFSVFFFFFFCHHSSKVLSVFYECELQYVFYLTLHWNQHFFFLRQHSMNLLYNLRFIHIQRIRSIICTQWLLFSENRSRNVERIKYNMKRTNLNKRIHDGIWIWSM